MAHTHTQLAQVPYVSWFERRRELQVQVLEFLVGEDLGTRGGLGLAGATGQDGRVDLQVGLMQHEVLGRLSDIEMDLDTAIELERNKVGLQSNLVYTGGTGQTDR